MRRISLFGEQLKRESRQNRAFINRTAYELAASGAGITRVNLALAKIDTGVCVLLLLILLFQHHYIVFTIVSFMLIFFSLPLFRFRTLNFGYLFSIIFAGYLIWTANYLTLTLLTVFLAINTINVRIQVENIKKSWEDQNLSPL